MGKPVFFWVFICCCLFVTKKVLAHSDLPIVMVGTDQGPPHMIERGQTGIDLDVTRFLLSKMHLDVQFQFVGLARARKSVLDGKFQAMVPTFLQEDEPGFYVSRPVIRYLPTVFSLADKGFQPTALEDLNGHSLVSFQGAVGYFGSRFKAVTDLSPYYREVSRMEIIPGLIAKDRFDYAVLDKYIFYYYFLDQKNIRQHNPFSEHKLIPPVHAAVGFSDKEMRDRFDRVAEGFVDSDEYREIIRRYTGMIQRAPEEALP